MKVEERIDKLRAKARQEELVVLVWGPGDPGPDASGKSALFWKKRNQIKEHLSAVFRNSEVLFSETESLRDYTRDLGDILTEELVHAVVADCIIVLDVSRGAHVEVDRFSTHPTIASKMTILLPMEYVGTTGLVAHVLKDLKVIGFSEDELESCKVATQKSQSIVERVALEKLMSAIRTPYL